MTDGRRVGNRVQGTARNIVQAGSIEVLNFHQFELPVPAQLPVPIRTLVNQHHVLTALDEVLAALSEDPAIVVLSGARGSGKSTAAVYWLQRHRERFPDGQLRADLGAWADHAVAPAEVLLAFITSLGVDRGEVPADLESRVNLFRSLTSGRSLQILLDDAVTAAQVKQLLPGPGRSMVVVTGQGGFGALAEHEATFIDVEPLEDDMAAELLRGFAGDRVDAEPAARAAMIALCGGRAVALSVVGRVLRDAPELSLGELLEELEPGGLTRMTVDGEPEIAAVLDAGYRRLTDAARRCYRVLGVHPDGNGVSLPALAAALKQPELTLRPVVRELVHGKRMVDQIDGRLHLDRLVGEHARNTADEVDGTDVSDLRRRDFVRWYAKGAIAADHVLQPHRPWMRELFPDVTVDTTHPAHRHAREWMLAERDTLRSAVQLAADIGELHAALHLCVAQWWLYESQKYSDDIVSTHKIGIDAAEELGLPMVKALLLVQQGYAERTRARFDTAVALLSQAAELARVHGNLQLEATAIEGAGLARFDQGHPGAAALLGRNVELARSVGEPRRIALACLHAAKPSEPAEALPLLDEAWAAFRGLDQPDRHNLAKVLLWQGRKLADHAEARARLDQALALMSELGRDFDRAQVLEALGDLLSTVDTPVARRHYLQAADTFQEGGHLLAAATATSKAERLG